jgi:hypothetical protein
MDDVTAILRVSRTETHFEIPVSPRQIGITPGLKVAIGENAEVIPNGQNGICVTLINDGSDDALFESIFGEDTADKRNELIEALAKDSKSQVAEVIVISDDIKNLHGAVRIAWLSAWSPMSA